jgi:hypothetical protein
MEVRPMTLPVFNREVSLMAESFTEALRISREDIEALWAVAIEGFGDDVLRSLHASTPRELPVEVFRANDGLITLWLGGTRIARLQR